MEFQFLKTALKILIYQCFLFKNKTKIRIFSAQKNNDCFLSKIPNHMNIKHRVPTLSIFLCSFLYLGLFSTPSYAQSDAQEYETLVSLFKEWRAFEKPPLREGAPDYTQATFEKRWPDFKNLQKKLQAIDTANWPIAHQVDWQLVHAEMNGYDFNHRILKPWVRDPAYYKTVWSYRSDVPAHEGPTHHMTTELWTYNFPLSKEERKRLLSDLKVIPPLNKQAKINLTGNAKDLWIAGIRDIERQSTVLKDIRTFDGVSEDTELLETLKEAIASTDDLTSWLRKEAVSKTGPSRGNNP